ncbi:MAG: hypothetical protein IJV99_02850 [Clostridia bacterium]|nr:hypothetical protein [Clostridia bacterium]
MRKLFVSIATIILSVIMCMTALSGCKLITTDVDRDMKQVVASVQIDKNAPMEKIYKKDMIMAYLNYGYVYEQYYGQTRKQVFEDIIDSLVQTRVFVQSAIKTLQEDPANVKNSSEEDVWSAARYLDAKDTEEALYNTYKTFNDLIESYETKNESDKFSETLSEEVRATPTNAANFVEDEDKTEYVAKGIDVNSTPARREAYSKVIKLMKNNGILGNYKGDIKETDYYKQTLKNNQEQILLRNFENAKTDAVRAKYDMAKLQTIFAEKLEKLGEMTNAEFVEKLSSATVSDPMLVGHKGNYGYVYNLLLGASEVQTEKINALDSNLSIAERAEKRREILEATTVKDLRSTWILSGYDFDANTKKFKGDYAFLSESIPFQGEVELVQEKTEDTNAKYKVTSLNESSLEEFISYMESYVYGANVPTVQTSPLGASVYRKAESNVEIADYEKKINELLFAFSTDAGSLNTYKGYAVKPIPDGADKEEYMQEFADGARELLGMGKSSYMVVATDYGYHVMFYSKLYDNSVFTNYSSLESYLTAEYGNKTWSDELATILANWNDEDAIKAYKNNYLYLFLETASSAEVTSTLEKYRRDTLNAYVYENDNYVKVYESRYSDLW